MKLTVEQKSKLLQAKRKSKSIRRENHQQRNALCACGSGKKYKHCCRISSKVLIPEVNYGDNRNTDTEPAATA